MGMGCVTRTNHTPTHQRISPHPIDPKRYHLQAYVPPPWTQRPVDGEVGRNSQETWRVLVPMPTVNVLYGETSAAMRRLVSTVSVLAASCSTPSVHERQRPKMPPRVEAGPPDEHGGSVQGAAPPVRGGLNSDRRRAFSNQDSPPAMPTSETSSDLRLADVPVRWEANQVMKTLGGIHDNLRAASYSAAIDVDEEHGLYAFDCSGMTQWVLRRAAPRAASAAAYKLPHRPLARDFYRRIASIPTGKHRFGWQRIEKVAEAKPGDVIAWIKPDIIRSPYTGHVAFVLLPPVPVPGDDNAYLVRIADSSRLLHDEDTRIDRDGFGFGTILLVTDPESGAPIGYGWVGLRWRAFETKIAIGRPLE